MIVTVNFATVMLLRLRRFTLYAVATVGVFSAFPSVGIGQSENVVVFAGWGGSIQKAERAVYFDSFEKQTGIKVIDVPDVQIAKIKAMVESGDVQWDVVQALGMWIPQGEKQNLWEPLDYEIIDKSDISPALAGPHGLGLYTAGIVLAYNKNAFPAGAPPKSWSDFWNVQQFPGRRAMQDAPRYSLESALLADGVAPDKLYPLDLDRAFRSLDRIKGSINVWWKQWPQVPMLLASQEITMSLTSHTRILSIVKEEHVPLAVAWRQSLMTVDVLAVPRGTRHRQNAMKLINWMMTSKLQAELARTTSLGPSNNAAMNYLTAAEREQLPTYHYQKGETVLFDNKWWADNEEKVTERWNTWKLK